MTDEEQRASDMIGGLKIMIDDDELGFRPGIAVEVIVRQGIKLPKGADRSTLVNMAMPHLREFVLDNLARIITDIDPDFITDRAMVIAATKSSGMAA